LKSEDILSFWFHELKPEDWFKKSETLDEQIRKRFAAVHAPASRGELWKWRENPFGRLAEIIILDQFSRNIYRDKPQAFASDTMALILAQETIYHKLDRELTAEQKMFVYMPFMHSESRSIHEQAVELFDGPGMEKNLEFELKHKEIIDRFGRYPHRNTILGRESTPEEIEFLKNPGSSF
jgi:uncharacterized protein (DUF924 family)